MAANTRERNVAGVGMVVAAVHTAAAAAGVTDTFGMDACSVSDRSRACNGCCSPRILCSRRVSGEDTGHHVHDGRCTLAPHPRTWGSSDPLHKHGEARPSCHDTLPGHRDANMHAHSANGPVGNGNDSAGIGGADHTLGSVERSRDAGICDLARHAYHGLGERACGCARATHSSSA